MQCEGGRDRQLHGWMNRWMDGGWEDGREGRRKVERRKRESISRREGGNEGIGKGRDL